MSSFRTIGVVGKQRDERVLPTLAALCAHLRELGRKVILDSQSAARLEIEPDGTAPLAELGRLCELVVVVGGDGTLLAAARALAAHRVPLLGINQGRLGFMVDVRPDAMREVIDAVLRGEYETDERQILSARILRAQGRPAGPYVAVNDVVVRNQASIRMLEFETWLDEDFISLHRADGMIVSSPTGSTAYALSGGGPLLHPSLSAIALVPICPHTLSDRPIVVGADRTVRLVMRGAERTHAMATFDGQVNETLNIGDTVEVRRAEHPLCLIHPPGYDYFGILRDKLRWGRAPETPSERA